MHVFSKLFHFLIAGGANFDVTCAARWTEQCMNNEQWYTSAQETVLEYYSSSTSTIELKSSLLYSLKFPYYICSSIPLKMTLLLTVKGQSCCRNKKKSVALCENLERERRWNLIFSIPSRLLTRRLLAERAFMPVSHTSRADRLRILTGSSWCML